MLWLAACKLVGTATASAAAIASAAAAIALSAIVPFDCVVGDAIEDVGGVVVEVEDAVDVEDVVVDVEAIIVVEVVVALNCLCCNRRS